MWSKIFLTVTVASLVTGPVLAQSRKPTDDLNGDGKVTVAEYAEARGVRAVERMDADKDGKITVAERLAAAGVSVGGGAEGRARAPGDGAAPANRGAGRAVGANEKRGATTAEMKASIRSRATAMDANGDGVLSLEEMRSGRGAQPAG